MVQPDDILRGASIVGGDFRVLAPLQGGGMGFVYLVEQCSTGKKRALKVLSPVFAADPVIRARFVREAKLAACIESAHVVEIVTAGFDEGLGLPYLVMELLRGHDLAQALHETGALPLGDVAEVFAQMGHALTLAHAQGIVHRDLKPENIFVAEPRRRGIPFTIKILDFGIAKLVADRQQPGTQPLGTPVFMPPEQTDWQGQISPASDVWSLGLLAFLMLTGRHYWRDANGSFPVLFREIVVDTLPPASVRADDYGLADLLPPGFDAWFAQCVHREPTQRFAEAGAAVRAFVALAPPNARRGRLVAPTPTPVPVVFGFPPPPGQPAFDSSMETLVPESLPPTADGSRQTSWPATRFRRSTSRFLSPWPSWPSWLGATASLLIAGIVATAGWKALHAIATSPWNTAPFSPSPTNSSPTESARGPITEEARVCPVGMIRVVGGSSFLGDGGGQKAVIADFCLDKTEVTSAAYDACVQTGACPKPNRRAEHVGATAAERLAFHPLCNAGREGREAHPINCVTWAMADLFCRTTGGRLPHGGGRLPTEVEWEFAARGTGQRTYPWGEELPDATRLNACGKECMQGKLPRTMRSRGMYDGEDGYAGTAPVGSFPAGASADGLLDLAGNVWEWTADSYAATTFRSPEGKSMSVTGERVIRGGAFNGFSFDAARPSFRGRALAKTTDPTIGFRCAAAVLANR